VAKATRDELFVLGIELGHDPLAYAVTLEPVAGRKGRCRLDGRFFLCIVNLVKNLYQNGLFITLKLDRSR